MDVANVCEQLCDGASASERQSWQLGQAKDFYYLNQSSCFQLKDVDNAEEYKVHHCITLPTQSRNFHVYLGVSDAIFRLAFWMRLGFERGSLMSGSGQGAPCH